jgi:hypothetical protein
MHLSSSATRGGTSPDVVADGACLYKVWGVVVAMKSGLLELLTAPAP